MTAGSLEPASVVGRSDIVLERPNLLAREAMPLGNGRLGVAVWGEEGFTAQLNRADTLPNRLSPGQVVLPGLKTLVAAADYAGRVDLYNGVRATRRRNDGYSFCAARHGCFPASSIAETRW